MRASPRFSSTPPGPFCYDFSLPYRNIDLILFEDS
jgi:hypothetical protein